MLDSTIVEYLPNLTLPLKFGIKENAKLQNFTIAVYTPVKLDASDVCRTSSVVNLCSTCCLRAQLFS